MRFMSYFNPRAKCDGTFSFYLLWTFYFRTKISLSKKFKANYNSGGQYEAWPVLPRPVSCISLTSTTRSAGQMLTVRSQSRDSKAHSEKRISPARKRGEGFTKALVTKLVTKLKFEFKFSHYQIFLLLCRISNQTTGHPVL